MELWVSRDKYLHYHNDENTKRRGNMDLWCTRLGKPVGRGIAAAAAAKSLQSCPTLWDPIDGSPPGSPVPGILQARTLEWVAISFSNARKWKVKGKSFRRGFKSSSMTSRHHDVMTSAWWRPNPEFAAYASYTERTRMKNRNVAIQGIGGRDLNFFFKFRTIPKNCAYLMHNVLRFHLWCHTWQEFLISLKAEKHSIIYAYV